MLISSFSTCFGISVFISKVTYKRDNQSGGCPLCVCVCVIPVNFNVNFEISSVAQEDGGVAKTLG